MAFLVPATIQKRVIRYALSQLSFLDMASLDLDQLEGAWGRRTTGEIKDIPFKIDKLTELLKLPDWVRIDRAAVRRLRLTVPYNIWSQGIEVAIDGIDIQCSIEEDRAKEKGIQKGVKSNRPRSPRHTNHDPGGTDHAGIPSIEEMAQSFVANQPESERERLRSELAQRSNLEDSQSSLDSEEELGMGAQFSLPAVMADFLWGIGERLKVSLKNISFEVSFPLEVPITGTAETARNHVSFRLTVDGVDLQGVQASKQPQPTSDNQQAVDLGNHKVVVTNINGFVVSEPSLFAAFSAMSIPSSQTTTQADSTRHETGSVSSRSMPSSSSSGPDVSMSNPSISDSQEMAMSTSTILDAPPDMFRSMYHDPQSREAMEDALSESIHESMIDSRYHGFGSEAGVSQFDEYTSPDQSFLESGNMESPEGSLSALGESETLPRGHLGAQSGVRSSIEASQLTDRSAASRASSYLPPPSQIIERTYDAEDRETTPVAEEQLNASALQQSIFHDFPAQENLPDDMLESQLFHDSVSTADLEAADEGREDLAIAESIKLESSTSLSTATETPETPDPMSSSREDPPSSMTQSTLFNAEEARSLYLSAQYGESDDTGMNIPGGWGAESADDDLPEAFASLHDDNNRHSRNDSDATLHASRASRGEMQSSRSRLSQSVGETSTVDIPSASQSSPVRPQSASNRSYTAMRRRFLSIDQIEIEIPVSLLRESSATAAGMPADKALATSQFRSKSTKMPGEMSLYDDTLSRLERSTMRASFTATRQESFGSDIPEADHQISVSFGKFALENDMGLTKLLVIATQQLLATRSTAQEEKPPAESKSVSGPAWILKVDEITWAFVDSMKSQLDVSTSSEIGSSGVATSTLLVTRARHISVAQKHSVTGSCISASIGQYTFGYVDKHIINFEEAIPGSERAKQQSRDVSVKIQMSQFNPPDIRLSTAPLRLSLDLRKLDETFGWFGGLNGMIDLSNSVISTTTIVEQKRAPKPTKVHFEPSRDLHLIDEKSPSENSAVKVTAVVNGIYLDLFGQSSSLHLDTSPLKMVHRSEGIGMQIDKINFNGPAIYDSEDEPPISISLGPLKVSYHQTPRESDLAMLLGLLSPSTQQQEAEVDDDVLVDTLLRQRRKGGVLRLTVNQIDGRIERLQELDHLVALSDEMKKLATVTKYLPEDDRPGAMILALVHETHFEIDVSPRLGTVAVDIDNIESACVTMPLLLLVGVDKMGARRADEALVGQVVPYSARRWNKNGLEGNNYIPMLRFKFIGNDLEPTLKLRIHNLCAEYHVTTIMAVMGISETATGEVVIAEMIQSVANMADTTTLPEISPVSTGLSTKSSTAKPMKLDLRLRDCAVGLNPRRSAAKGMLVLSSAQLSATLPENADAPVNGKLRLKKVSFLVVDDAKNLRIPRENSPLNAGSTASQDSQIAILSGFGYVSIMDLSEAKIVLKMSAKTIEHDRTMDIEVEDKLLVIDSCADSTQTMIAIFSGLSPPMPPSDELKYRLEGVNVEDMLGSIVGEMVIPSSDKDQRTSSQRRESQDSLDMSPDVESFDFAKQLGYALPDAEDDRDLSDEFVQPQKKRGLLNLSNKDFFVPPPPTVKWGGVALEFDYEANKYCRAAKDKIAGSPLRLRLKEVNLIWNLFDGYDWQHTRNVIGEAVADVEKRAAARKAHRRRSYEAEEFEEEDVIGDFLFNSVYIGVGKRDDPRDLARQINRHLADDDLETASYATPTTIVSNTTSARSHFSKTRRKHLRLERSKHQKITIDLRGVSADVVVYPPGSGETQTSLALRVHDLEIFDHIRTSTWKKFATYMHDYGARDVSSPMISIDLLNIRPVIDLPASELAIRVQVSPLRLHVDQDAIDFLTRFFEFKDSGRADAPPPSEPGEEPFIQRFEIFAVPVKLDFKPKRVDYAGLKSGKTTEFMNFIILDGSDMVLDHVILYGTSGFERLGKMLNDIWMPAIKQNQLPGVLAGLAPVRGIVNVGSGVKDLVMVPWKEYKKDGRLVRAIQKGTFAFAKNTTTELTKLGARVALGTQTILQNTEGLLTGQLGGDDGPTNVRNTPGTDEDKPQVISPYADQPLGVMSGLRGAYKHLQRDMLYARDAVIAMPGEIRDSGSASGAARAVLRGAPTVVLRPAMGVTRAIGTAFMGATNALDKDERRRTDDKYKKH